MGANNIYKDYNGMPCVSREINPDNWTWTYIYENKNAKKNENKYNSLNKTYVSLQNKIEKSKETLQESYNKFYKITGLNSEDEINILDNSYDEVKGIATIRNKINKSIISLKENEAKCSELYKEMQELEKIGFDEFVAINTTEMVYAYDMQNYVRMHPEKYNIKK
jgi:hypothetical protein